MMGPAMYMNAAGWAPSGNSLIAHATITGAATPPMSSLRPTRNHSPCCHARSDFLEGLWQAHRMCRGVECRRVAVGFGKGLRQGALGQPRRLVEHLPNRLRVQVAELARRKCLLQVQHLKQVELQIAHVALVVTHHQRPFVTDSPW